MRYGIAIVVAVLIIGAGAFFVWKTERSIEQELRQGLRVAKAAGTLPAEIDPDRADLADFGVELTDSQMWRMRIAHLLFAWRFALIPMVLIVSLATARIVKRKPS